jgi:hypothetical protein
MEFDSDLEPQFCSSNKIFCPSDLYCHVQEKHQDILGFGVRIYLGTLFGNEFGQGDSIRSCCIFLPNFLSHAKHTYSGLTYYGLFPKGTIQCKISMGKAQIRDKYFLASYVESQAIPWQFEFENVTYIITCSMDTLLMTLFLLWH